MASVTKVMTLTLIFEAIDSGYLDLQDTVTFSEHAASMGGSQAFFEAGEIQTVETLIKCISIASANDAAVAMAEAVSGSEEAFVARMNEKAAALSMTNTHFVNCCGLDDSDHYSSARDLAVISRELILSHPEIFSYCTIWQEDITHTTSRGSFPFTLTNTNKLLKQYPYATGLKTGSTSKAKYCLSATATKDNITMIAVIMGAETAKDRFKDAAALLNYGFANTIVYQEDSSGDIFEVPVQKGVADSVQGTAAFSFSYISTRYIDTGLIQRKENLKENLTAPVQVGDTIGTLDYYLQDQQIGSVPVIAAEAVSRATYPFYLQQTLHQFFGSNKAGK
jgi:D-alanyl-D-alanine carboxypeptidase (penicillin-binding protein 5/6)